MDAASGGKTGVNRITPGDIDDATGIVQISSPNLIGIIGTAPPCGHNLIEEVCDIRQSTPQVLVRQSQQLDTAVDDQLMHISWIKFSKMENIVNK